jgi:hypothetical protein
MRSHGAGEALLRRQARLSGLIPELPMVAEEAECEHRGILAAAGLELLRVMPTQSPLRLSGALPAIN